MIETVFQKLVLVAGLAVLAAALRHFENVVLRKLSILLVLAASYLAAYFLFDSHLAGVGAVLGWFFLPWIELLTRIRSLRLPREKKLEHMAPPSPHRFPMLEEMTDEIEVEGYEYVDDAGWEWEATQQFFRILRKAGERHQVMICLNEQNEMGFAYVAITSRDGDGGVWRTWNYPFSLPMKVPPGLTLNRVERADSFEELMAEHEAFLEVRGVRSEDLVEVDPEVIHAQIEQEVRDQVDYNLACQLVAPAGEETVRYSWRGLIFLWAQFIKDMVKLS